MTSLAFLETPLTCPSCGGQVTDQAWFQWGFCRGRGQSPESTYRPGERVRWRHCADGSVPHWTQFSSPAGHAGQNLGSADVRDLLVRDVHQEWLYDDCPLCGEPLDGAVVEIRDGVVAGGRLLAPGELPTAEYLLPGPDGVTPVESWTDGPLDVRDDCTGPVAPA